MNPLVEFLDKPKSEDVVMIAGWRQWADAGDVSSALPMYLVEELGAHKIGQIRSDSFYLFQLPGTHDVFRPEIKLENGYRKELAHRKNEFYFAGNERKGVVIFVGDEPHLRIEEYADAFFTIARELNVRRVVALGGVYSAVPYDKDRQISCTYSQTKLKSELDEYAVNYSNYSGGVSIGSYLLDPAEKLGIEYIAFYAIVPMYDLSQLSPMLQGFSVEQDFKAWHDVMRRLNYMLKFQVDLADLERKSRDVIASVQDQIAALEEKTPGVDIREFFSKLAEEFEEPNFAPLDDVWTTGLNDLFKEQE